MSIIREAIEHRKGLRPGYSGEVPTGDRVEKKNPKILDLSLLKDYVRRVLDHMKVDSSPSHTDYRKHIFLWEVPIGNILGRVDEPTWVYMIEKQANWVIDSREAVQPNGRWHIYAHELDIVTKNQVRTRAVGRDADGRAEVIEIEEPTDYLRVGIQIVDIAGESDLRYEMGRPTTKKDSFDPGLLKQLMKGAPVTSSREYEDKIEEQGKKLSVQESMIGDLQKESTRTNELMAALLTELQELKGQRKVVSRTGRKKANG